jgi:hypothetical protein
MIYETRPRGVNQRWPGPPRCRTRTSREITLEGAAAAIGAAGTIAAILVALFLPDWQRFRSHPSLTLSFDPTSEDVAMIGDKGQPEVWFRFRVTNSSRRETARNVRVMVTDVKALAGSRMPDQTIPYRELLWADLGVGVIDIPPGVSRRVDIVRIGDRDLAEAKSAEAMNMWLAMWPYKHSRRDRLGSGRFAVGMVVAGDNFSALPWETIVSFDPASVSLSSSSADLRAAASVNRPQRRRTT